MQDIRAKTGKVTLVAVLMLAFGSCSKQPPSDRPEGFDASVDGVAIEPIVPLDGEHAERMLADRDKLESWQGFLTPSVAAQQAALSTDQQQEQGLPVDAAETQEPF